VAEQTTREQWKIQDAMDRRDQERKQKQYKVELAGIKPVFSCHGSPSLFVATCH
jgi:hypothetical protein